MARKRTEKPQQPAEVEHIDNPEDACTDAAYRIVVVQNLLSVRQDEDQAAEDDGGYGLVEAQRILSDIRTQLLKSVAEAEKQRASERTTGGAR